MPPDRNLAFPHHQRGLTIKVAATVYAALVQPERPIRTAQELAANSVDIAETIIAEYDRRHPEHAPKEEPSAKEAEDIVWPKANPAETFTKG